MEERDGLCKDGNDCLLFRAEREKGRANACHLDVRQGRRRYEW